MDFYFFVLISSVKFSVIEKTNNEYKYRGISMVVKGMEYYTEPSPLAALELDLRFSHGVLLDGVM